MYGAWQGAESRERKAGVKEAVYMKIAVLEGSPHKNGSSNLLAKQFIRGAEEAGHSVTVLDAAHMNMHPCIGCDHCGIIG